MAGLQGKVAIVTGGAQGLGRAFSLGLARQGANIAIADLTDARETKAGVEKLGSKALVVRADVSSEADTERMAREVYGALGRIDILVNNAGIYPQKGFEEMSFAEWRKVLAVNLDGLFLCSKAVVPYMKRNRWGRIVNISSGVFMMAPPNLVHYVTSKGGVIGFTRALATDLGAHGITVNSVAPGFTNTPGTDTEFRVAEDRKLFVAMRAIKREEMPEDLVGAVVFFASEEAAFITGQTLCVDGGCVRD